MGERSRGFSPGQLRRENQPQRQVLSAAGARNSGAPAMPNVLNPEPESITLNTELETPTLEPATELDSYPRIDQSSRESTSTPETAEVVTADELAALDADAPTEPVIELAHVDESP